MSEHRGYEGNSLKFLKANQISVGDSVKILSDITYSGIIMPRYEHSDDKHIVLKLKSGYNIGLEIAKIEKEIKKFNELLSKVNKGNTNNQINYNDYIRLNDLLNVQLENWEKKQNEINKIIKESSL